MKTRISCKKCIFHSAKEYIYLMYPTTSTAIKIMLFFCKNILSFHLDWSPELNLSQNWSKLTIFNTTWKHTRFSCIIFFFTVHMNISIQYTPKPLQPYKIMFFLCKIIWSFHLHWSWEWNPSWNWSKLMFLTPCENTYFMQKMYISQCKRIYLSNVLHNLYN